MFGQRLTERLRVDSFKSILKQEIGWFDDEKNATGILTLRLSQDAANVQGVSHMTHTSYQSLALSIFPDC